MPIGSVKTPSDKPAAGRTSFRPSWVKDTKAAEPAKPVEPAKTTPTWKKSTTTTPAAASKSTTATSPSKPTSTTAAKTPAKTIAATKTTTPSATKATTPAKTTATTKSAVNGDDKTSKLQSREVKVPVVTTKPKDIKVVAPEDNYETSSSEYEEVTDSEAEDDEDVSYEEVTATDSDEDSYEIKPAFDIKLKPVDKPKPKVEKSPSTDRAGKFVKPVLKKVPKIDEVPKAEPAPLVTLPEVQLKKVTKPEFKEPPPSEPKAFVRPPLKKVDSIKKPSPPMPPPPPPSSIGPPPPPPPGMSASNEKKKMSDSQKATIEKLKSRPRRRPDWSDMMKEVEEGRKLRHVTCNDRSNPILKTDSIAKIDDQFIFESEKDNKHNELLIQIQSGFKLKSVKTNDRSKPNLEGLRKFRKQMTIEEQIQKSESRAQLGQAPEEVPTAESADDLDDIDKVRDDLQSTKQMLSQELRNKEAQERENKRLLAKIQQLEAELTSSKDNTKSESKSSGSGDSTALVKSLKDEVEEAQKIAKQMEKKYQDAAEQLDVAKSEAEKHKITIATLEKKMSTDKGSSASTSRRTSVAPIHETSPEPDFESSGGEEDEDDEKKAERMKRRLVKEVKFLRGKLIRLGDKEKLARKERQAIREAMKKNQLILKEEKKKYKKLQREVDKMAALMKEDEDDDEEKEEKEEPEEKNEASDDDSESDESGSEEEDDESSESEAEDAPAEKKKANYEPRIKKHDGRLAALKKGNMLRQTNLDRLVDEINKIREEQVELQHDLDSVLSELG